MLFVLLRGPNSSEKFEQIKTVFSFENYAYKITNILENRQKLRHFFSNLQKLFFIFLSSFFIFSYLCRRKPKY